MSTLLLTILVTRSIHLVKVRVKPTSSYVSELYPAPSLTELISVQSVAPLDNRMVRVVFTNGEQRDIDLSSYIVSGPIFEPVRDDLTFFRSVQVEGGTIAWPNGADIDPDVLYYAGPPPWASAHASTAI